MIPVSLKSIEDILQGNLVGEDITIANVVIDSRKYTQKSLFVAIKGEFNDGHYFVEQALLHGAVALLVEKIIPIDVPQIIVDDTRLALGKLASWVRCQISAKLVALTGSSGKTSVKEMAAAILNQKGNVLYTEGNLNNSIGVPLTLLRFQHHHDYGVIEIGANHFGEVGYNTNLVKPQSALIVNLGIAHLQGFRSIKGVAKAKGEIFDHLVPGGTAIINNESHDLKNWQKKLLGKRLWRFSIQDSTAEFTANRLKIVKKGIAFNMITPFGKDEVWLPYLGEHNVYNALAASALSMSVGANLKEVKEGLSNFKTLPGRLFPIWLEEKKLILDDTYNANVNSVSSAIQTLSKMPGYRVMVVGDVLELGNQAEKYHHQMGREVKLASINEVLSVGELSKNLSFSSGCGKHYKDKKSMVVNLISLICEHEEITVLIKGSRNSRMEEVVKELLKEWRRDREC